MCYVLNKKQEKNSNDYNMGSCVVIEIRKKEIVEISLTNETKRYKR